MPWSPTWFQFCYFLKQNSSQGKLERHASEEIVNTTNMTNSRAMSRKSSNFSCHSCDGVVRYLDYNGTREVFPCRQR
eukprot:2186021-Amphidinium_carterae.1